MTGLVGFVASAPKWRRDNVSASCKSEHVIERSIDLLRFRRMRCGSCGYEWAVTAEWLDRFERGLAACPVCDTDCRSEDRPDFCADPDDPVREDSAVPDFYWYHSSTHENWPDSGFDPAAGLTEETKRCMERMGSGTGAVERWAERQKAKALHVGTYEAAIESMFRRMRNQADSLDQFYLYRIRLDPDCVIAPGVHKEPTNWLGDAYLADVCSVGTHVLRYVNVHEDQSSVSLAIELDAVRAVQMTPIPLPVDASDPWVLTATQRLLTAASKPSPRPVMADRRWRKQEASPLVSEAGKLELEVGASLPPALRERFSIGFREEALSATPDSYPKKLVGMARLVTNAQATLDALDRRPWRVLNSSGV